MQVALARKELDAIEQQGMQALTLIRAAAPAKLGANRPPTPRWASADN
jgi:hypothetical protein